VRSNDGGLVRACIVNIGDRGRVMLERLAAEGRSAGFWQVEGSARWCFELAGELSVGFEGYAASVPEAVPQKRAVMEALRGEFRRHVVNEVLRTLSGARVVDVTDYHVVLEQTERTEITCARHLCRGGEAEKRGLGERPESLRVPPHQDPGLRAVKPLFLYFSISPPYLTITYAVILVARGREGAARTPSHNPHSMETRKQ